MSFPSPISGEGGTQPQSGWEGEEAFALIALHGLIVSTAAAVAGSLFGALIFFGSFSGWQVTLAFTAVGSLGFLLPAYAMLRKGRPTWLIYVLLCSLGASLGGLMLFWATWELVPLGIGFGFLTSIFWILLHALTARMLALAASSAARPRKARNG